MNIILSVQSAFFGDVYTALCSDLGCKTVANMIKGKTPEEIRQTFNIVNDFTAEEEVGLKIVICQWSCALIF